MNARTRVIQWSVWGLLLAVILGIGGAFIRRNVENGSSLRRRPLLVYGWVPDFTLTNQFGQPVSLAVLQGHIWVADIIFTRCPGPCARMTALMSDIQAAVPTNQPVKFLSLTTDPEFDAQPILNSYGSRSGAAP